MKKPISLSLFNDVKAVLDKVLTLNREAELAFATEANAFVWMHRANRFRKTMRMHDEAKNNLLPGQGESPYDPLMFSKRGKVVTIKLRVAPATVTFLDNEITSEADKESDPYANDL